MTRWMNGELQAGHAMGSMMWGTPRAMRDSCRRWVIDTDNRADLSRCDAMVGWMTEHVHDWNGWMMNGSGMMG